MPKYAKQFLIDAFGQARADIIEQNWDRFIEIRFSESTKQQIIKAGKLVEECLAS